MAEGIDQTERGGVKETVEAKGPQPVVEAVDEDAPRTDEDEEEIESITTEDEVVVRKRPLYKRPAFLLIAAIMQQIAAADIAVDRKVGCGTGKA